ncbi:MAG: N-acetylmuramoyl-L-alanine amidase, partial [Filifactor alocis]|nr:N-acetylmuramoyl-L-alanine amidase [Filifactor alocis]
MKNKKITSNYISPLNIDNRVYIAVQDLEQLNNSEVKWDKKNQTINIKKDGKHIKMKKGNSFYHLNGKKVNLAKGTKVQIVNSRSMIPLSFAISEFKMGYNYDSASKTLYLNDGQELFEEESAATVEKPGEVIQTHDNSIDTGEGNTEISTTVKNDSGQPSSFDTRQAEQPPIVENSSDNLASPKDNSMIDTREVAKEPAAEFSPIDNVSKTVPETNRMADQTSSAPEIGRTSEQVPSVPAEKKVTVRSSQDTNRETLQLDLSESFGYDVAVNSDHIIVVLPKVETSYNLQELRKISFFQDMVVRDVEAMNQTVFTIYLNPFVSKNLLKVDKSNRTISFVYEKAVITQSSLSYKKDRSHSIVKIPLMQSSSQIRVFNRGRDLDVTIPKEVVVLSEGRITADPSDRMLEYYEITSSDTSYNLVFSLKDRVDHRVLDDGTGGSLELRFDKKNHSPGKIVIDPGHGGKDSGAVKNGYREKDLNLDISMYLIADLQAYGYEVITTRTDDSYPTLDERAILANNVDADLFISVHNNSAEKKTEIKGIETYYSPGAQDSKKFADLVHRNLIRS